MKLYNKFLILICVLAMTTIILILIFFNSILLRKFSSIEKDNIVSNVDRVHNALNEEVNNLDYTVNGYAAWDNSYIFSKDKNKEFISSNYGSYSTLKRFRFNFIIYTDKDDQIILSKGYNLDIDKAKLLDEKLESEILLKVKGLMLVKNSDRIKGITEVNNTPTILIIQPITTSDGKKTSGGHVIAGRFLDKQQISQLSSRVKVDLSVEKYNKTLELNRKLKWINNFAVINTNKNTSIGYEILPNIENTPYLVIKLNITREIYNQARTSIIYLIIIIIFAFFVSLSILFIYFKKKIAKRIIQMNITIDNISDTRDLTIKMKADGNDEITSVALGFNNMIDELKKYSYKIELGNNKYYSLISNMLSCFSYNKLVFNTNGIPIDLQIIDGNDAFFEYIGLTRDKVIGRNISDLKAINKIDIDSFNSFVDVAMNLGEKKIEEVYVEKIARWFTITVYSIEEGYFAVMFSDITQKKKTEERNLELANQDMLTGLPNRKMILEKINLTIDKKKKNGGKFSILFLDLDNFKRVNDSLGHDVGDFLIQKVSTRYKNVISPSEVVARIGGDEFIILQEGINSAGEAEYLAQRIKNVLKESFIYMSNELYTTASIGISVYPDDGEDMSSLMKNSDIAMYEAKKNGGNGYKLYSQNMNKEGLTNLILESSLYKALEKKEMVLYYQAITHVQSKKIIGFEALIRWIHDEKIIPPLDFIPMAENNGYIIELGEWVLREACMQCRNWHNSGMRTYVTVNITFKQLEQDDFVDIVSNSLKEANLDSKYLVLEITENMAMQNVELTIKTLKKIKNLGVSIALDDFGTGYSSLSYVNRLPVDIIKIDRSLIINIAHGTENIEIIKAIIAMAVSLNIKVVVEGVEEIEQFIILKRLQSYAIQGYLISRPLPAGDIKSLIAGEINLP